ncbi:MAG: MerR family transcriptional regulator [Candidatus Omnitrophica bacterium]|nr:MerR family transcriptional regulator [Candidatus Omnitrophota bacterium]MCK5393544.1 MerR family transcriptional regulator [Candidatus Omnitrophota bacterium]MCK5493832.1 MerR family transcriptional regulator [Candidatus Omnitrophota bacterium]
MGKNTYYKIEEAAKELGLSKQTILRYEAKGVFPKSRRNRINKWREYTEKDIKKLKTILGR